MRTGLASSRLSGQAIAALALWVVLAPAAVAQTPLPPAYNYDEPLPRGPKAAPPTQVLQLGTAPAGYRMPVLANRKLDSSLQHIRRTLVVLHGDRRHARRDYQDIEALLQRDATRRADTLILALEFPSTIDSAHADRPAWRKNAWVNGARSVQAPGRPPPVSAFQVLDDLLHLLANRERLPALTDIVLAGHANGAQLLQRYAVLNGQESALRDRGLALRYVIANAPSYLYLTHERPRRRGVGFEPYERGICPPYNQYPYGLQKMPDYAGDADPASLYLRYAERDVVYLLGSGDTNPEARGLDQRCGAEAQGSTRLSRGLGYLRHDRLLAGRGAHPIMLRHEHQQVMGVAHDAAAMFGSLCGVRALLGDGASTAPGAAPCQPISP